MNHHLENPVRKDLEAIDAQVGALDAVFKVGVAPQDRWIALKWILRMLTPAVDAHLQREWEQIAEASQWFVEMLKDHEKSEEQLLLDVLETGLKRSELL